MAKAQVKKTAAVKVPDKLTGSSVVGYLAAKCGLARKDTKVLVEELFDLVAVGVMRGERVALGKIGKMFVRMRPARPVELDRRLGLPRSGLLFVGEKGKLLAGYSGGNPFRQGGKPRGPSGGLLLPEAAFRDFADPPKTLPSTIVALDARGHSDFERLQQRMHLRAPSPKQLSQVPEEE